MKYLVFPTVLLLVACPPGEPEPVQAEMPPPSSIGTSERPASVFVPDGYDGWGSLPVVFGLGGYDDSASDYESRFRLLARVNPMGFILVQPSGTVDQDGAPFWNATDACCDFYDTGVDDVGYLTGLVDEVLARFASDPDRVYFFGHGAGGFMSYRMACEAESPLAGVMSVSGSTWLRESACEATHSISVLHAHGLGDEVTPYVGDFEAPGADVVVNRWGDRAGCDPRSWSPTLGEREYVDDGEDSETVVAGYTEGCESGIDIELWQLGDNGHFPATNDAFTDDALRFFLE